MSEKFIYYVIINIILLFYNKILLCFKKYVIFLFSIEVQ